MAKENWTSIRVRRSTRDKLNGIIETLRRAADQGQYQALNRHTVDITVDDCINVLIERDIGKRTRAKKSRSKASKAQVHTVDLAACNGD